jgi:hypothetical protein
MAGTTILFVVFPSIQADFSSVSTASLSWVLNAYTIVFAALLISVDVDPRHPASLASSRVGGG